MKRTIIASLATISLAASLAACGSDSDSTASSEATTDAAATQAATTTQKSSTTTAAEGTPVPVASVLTYTAPEGTQEETDSDGAVGLAGADANGNLIAIAIAAETSDQDAEAAVKTLAATGGLLNSSTQTSSGEVTFTEGGAVTVAGETGFSWSTQSTLASGGGQAARGVYVAHNGTLVAIAYTVTSVSGTPELSDADFQAFLDSIAWV